MRFATTPTRRAAAFVLAATIAFTVPACSSDDTPESDLEDAATDVEDAGSEVNDAVSEGASDMASEMESEMASEG